MSQKVEYLLIGPREDLESYQSAFEKRDKKAVIFDPRLDCIKIGIDLLRQTSGAVVTFGLESLPINRDFLEALAETRNRIPSIMIIQPSLCSFAELINQFTEIETRLQK